jgi:lactate dehydrogenase-like 2-hydroxyacid dehydrogenase
MGDGTIGRQTARIAHTMGMGVHACTLHLEDAYESRPDNLFTVLGFDGPEVTSWI